MTEETENPATFDVEPEAKEEAQPPEQGAADAMLAQIQAQQTRDVMTFFKTFWSLGSALGGAAVLKKAGQIVKAAGVALPVIFSQAASDATDGG